eukprot:10531359-Heterocapsa_arctica.AAC.1
MEDISEQEEIVAKLRDNFKTERCQRWRLWVDNSWAHKTKDIYRWIKGSKSAGPLIVIPGGSAQMADRLKEAEKTWGDSGRLKRMNYQNLRTSPWNLSPRMKSEE